MRFSWDCYKHSRGTRKSHGAFFAPCFFSSLCTILSASTAMPNQRAPYKNEEHCISLNYSNSRSLMITFVNVLASGMDHDILALDIYPG
jgi:hypothetical protein